MNGVARFVLLLALGLWIGTIASVSFLVAPVAFTILAPAQATTFKQAMETSTGLRELAD